MIFLPCALSALDIYPFSYDNYKEIEGGQVLEHQGNYKFVRTGLLGDDALIYDFDITNLKRFNGIALDQERIIASHLFLKNLFILSARKDSLYLNVVNDKNEIQKFFLTSINDANYRNVRFQTLRKNHIILNVANSLFSFDLTNQELPKIELLSENCLQFTTYHVSGKSYTAFLEDNRENSSLTICDDNGNRIHRQIVPFSDNFQLVFSAPYLLIINGNSSDNSLVSIINTSTWLTANSFWVPADAGNISVLDGYTIFYLTYRQGAYRLVRLSDFSRGRPYEIGSITLKKEMIEPISMLAIGNRIFLSFKNALLTFDKDLNIESLNFLPLGKWFNSINDIRLVGEKLIISGNHFTVVFQRREVSLWQAKSFYYSYGRFILPSLLLIVIILLYQYIRHLRRQFNLISELSSIGFIFVIDKSFRLEKSNYQGKNLLKLKDNISLGKVFSFYFKEEQLFPLLNFFLENSKTKDTISQRINLVVESEPKEWFVHLIPITNIAGQSRGFILNGTDITEQLERKRLTNWAQLAHDMQTNLSTIRLNTEHLDIELNENNKSRQKKILHQVNILMNRIRDVVTVGRSDALNLQDVASTDIIAEVRSEFDEVVFPNVQFQMNAINFQFKCDRSKLVRAIRNACENGIRALQGKNGIISISCYKDKKFVYFVVKDSGVGMDDFTKKRFLQPYFTTGSTTGGSGIGTMIMLRVAELHGGKLEISSEKDKGTEITFVLPYLI